MKKETIFVVMITAALAGGCGYILGRWSKKKECDEEVARIRKHYSDAYSKAIERFSKKEEEYANAIRNRATLSPSHIDTEKPEISDFIKKYRGEDDIEDTIVDDGINDEEESKEMEEQEEAEDYIPREVAELHPDDGNTPFIIAEEESGTTGYTEVYTTLYLDDKLVEDHTAEESGTTGYTKVYTTLYFDDKLVEDHTAEEIDIDDSIGMDIFDRIINSSDEYVFVRNPRLGIDYAVAKSDENWTDVAKDYYNE